MPEKIKAAIGNNSRAETPQDTSVADQILALHSEYAAKITGALPEGEYQTAIAAQLEAMRTLLRLAVHSNGQGENAGQSERSFTQERNLRFKDWARQVHLFGSVQYISSRLTSYNMKLVFECVSKAIPSSGSDIDIIARTIGHQELMDAIYAFDPAKEQDLQFYLRQRLQKRIGSYLQTEAPELMKAHHQTLASVSLGSWSYRIAQTMQSSTGEQEDAKTMRFVTWAKNSGLPGENKEDLILSASIRNVPWLLSLAEPMKSQLADKPTAWHTEIVQSGVLRLNHMLRTFDPAKDGGDFQHFAYAEIVSALHQEYQFLADKLQQKVARIADGRPRWSGNDWEEPANSARQEGNGNGRVLQDRVPPPVSTNDEAGISPADNGQQEVFEAAVALPPEAPKNEVPLANSEPPPADPTNTLPKNEGEDDSAEDDSDDEEDDDTEDEDESEETDTKNRIPVEDERQGRFVSWAQGRFGFEEIRDFDGVVTAIKDKFSPLTESFPRTLIKKIEKPMRGKKLSYRIQHICSLAKTAMNKAVDEYDPEVHGDFVMFVKGHMEKVIRAELRPQIMQVR